MSQEANHYKPSENYSEKPLQREALAEHPMDQFSTWFEEATSTQEPMPESMSVASVSAEGVPSTRMVLCKHTDSEGFVFYTNYESAKAKELEQNPHAALLFHWKPLARQVRVTGTVERVSREMSEGYFSTRRRGSQLAAWASPQSQTTTHQDMRDRYAAMEEKFSNQTVPTPPLWGGYRVRPTRIEFWQGRSNRFHDRFVYTRQPDGTWTIERLAP